MGCLSFLKTIVLYLVYFLINYLALYGVLSAPTLLQSCATTVALGDALASYYAWVSEKHNLLQGLTSAAFVGVAFTTCWLICDAYAPKSKMIALGASLTPATLEDGTAATSAEPALETQVALPTLSRAPTVLLKFSTLIMHTGLFIFGFSYALPVLYRAPIVLLVFQFITLIMYTGFFIFGFSYAGVVSLEQSPLTNARDTVLYIVGGWQVMVGPAMIRLFLNWVAQVSLQVLLDAKPKTEQTKEASVGVLGEGEKPYTDAEKV
ncbi:hypothetical protein B0H19DRAFT_694551 [Mycena capillaripes]|nr:hypothetical protein B0H19DRAFT_694551 [Mycena capillaripes]